MRIISGIKKRPLVLAMLMSLSVCAASSYGNTSKLQNVHLKEQTLSNSLRDLAQQADLQILFYSDLTDNIPVASLNGQYSVEQALDTLLHDTDLQYRYLNEHTLTVYKKDQPELVPNDAGSVTPERPLPAQPTETKELTRENASSKQTKNDKNVDEDEDSIEKIVVVGTRIRGAETASPTFTFDRDDIAKTGAATTQSFIQTLPQHFNGGASENSGVFPTPVSVTNSGAGGGLNLRGLGNRATLVLVDGHRMAPSADGAFVDISMIPLSAIESIELLTDGASAIYGSDAVSGVINFTLRDDYEGAETMVRYGNVTSGSSEEFQLGQTFGTNWTTDESHGGNFIGSYEYYTRNPLMASDRSFTSTIPGPMTLFPSQDRHSVFTAFNQELSNDLNFYGRGNYSERNSATAQTFGGTYGVFGNRVDAVNRQYGGIAGLVKEMENGWNADFSYMYNFSSTESDIFDLFTDELTGNYSTESEIQALELVFDGPFSLGESNASAAFGVAYREEVFDDLRSLEVSGIEGLLDRDVAAVFGEIWWPLFTPADERTGLNRLELSFSLRYEHYSDFGDTTDPKVGVLWAPTEDLNLRTTWGTSFRAPLLSELNENDQSSSLKNYEDVDGNRLVGLLAHGNNSELTQETATNWTTGIDYEPAYVPGLKLSMSYFDINFKDRISAPYVGTLVLTQPHFSSLLTYNPEPALIDRFTQVNYQNLTTLPYPGYGPPAAAEDTDVFIDGRLSNAANTRTRGIDLNLNYGFQNSAGVWQLSLYSSYLLDMENKLTEDSPPEQQLNQPFYPVDLKNRLGINWQSNEGNLASSLYVNYTDSYKGNVFTPMDIDSFTTVDLNLSYDTEYAAGFLGGMQFSLNVQNLFDEDPPFKDGEGTGFNFDPNNASPLGRFVSLNVVKQW